MSNRFSPEIFIQSLPQGKAQRENELSILHSKMIAASINVYLDIFEKIIIPEKDIDSPHWNPTISLKKWLDIFKIPSVILNNDYSDPEFLNYIVCFYNRLLVHRPIPISLLALNILFDEYKDLGMSIRFDNVFILGNSSLGEDECLGLPGSSSIISIDYQAKYFEYYPVIVRLLLRILPINASIRVESPFSFGGEIPSYDTFQVVHNCNASYHAIDTDLIYAEGDFEINQSPILALESNNFLVKKDVVFNLIPFRSNTDETSLYVSFFILNSTSQEITINLATDSIDATQQIRTYTISDIAVDRWTAVLIEISDLENANTIKTLSLHSDKNINNMYNQFYIDQVRIYTGEDRRFSNLYIETELNNKIIK